MLEAKRLKRHMQSLPQFTGVNIAVFGYTQEHAAYICLDGWCANHQIRVEWKHKAELGRWVYVYLVNRHLKVFDQESLLQIIHRDMVMNRMGVTAGGSTDG